MALASRGVVASLVCLCISDRSFGIHHALLSWLISFPFDALSLTSSCANACKYRNFVTTLCLAKLVRSLFDVENGPFFPLLQSIIL